MERVNGEDLLRITNIIMNTARAVEEFLETSCLIELDQIFGTILEKLNTFFRKVEDGFKNFVVFEMYVICAYTRDLGFTLKNIPEEVRNRVYELRDSQDICGFTGRECVCGKSVEFLKQRFSEKMSALMSSGEALMKGSSDLKKGMEDLGKEVESLTEIARKIMNIAELIEIIALNAYIEAARLGEHGRSFKVIADEVRRASVKTNELASEIVESIRTLQDRFTQQIAKQREFDESMSNLERDQRSFSEDLNRDLLWMTQNFLDFIEYMRKFMEEDMALLQEVRSTILSVLQSIDLTNQRVGNTAKALHILAKMIEEFERTMKGEKDLKEAYKRVEDLYEEFRRIPKLRDEREIIAKVEGKKIDRDKEMVGERLEDIETDVELF